MEQAQELIIRPMAELANFGAKKTSETSGLAREGHVWLLLEGGRSWLAKPSTW